MGTLPSKIMRARRNNDGGETKKKKSKAKGTEPRTVRHGRARARGEQNKEWHCQQRQGITRNHEESRVHAPEKGSAESFHRSEGSFLSAFVHRKTDAVFFSKKKHRDQKEFSLAWPGVQMRKKKKKESEARTSRIGRRHA